MELIKTAGIDGIILDYYGVAGSNGDIESLQINSDKVIQAVHRHDLKFIIMEGFFCFFLRSYRKMKLNSEKMEDRFARGVNDVLQNVQYIKENYMSLSSYALDEKNQPWLMIYGPNSNLTDDDWNNVLGNESVRFITHSFNLGVF